MSQLKGRCILIVDDEELLVEMTSMLLEQNGAQVLTACSGKAGVEVFKANQDKIDSLLVDFSMSDLNGYEVFKAVKALKPSLKVVMASGLRSIPEVEQLRKSGEIGFISKPFFESDLLRALA